MPAQKRVSNEQKATSKVVIVYEDERARAQAVSFSDQLVERFWLNYDFEVSWWSCQSLAEAGPAREATEKVCEADLLVFASSTSAPLPEEIKAWIENSSIGRGGREGALVDLIDSHSPDEKHFYLREVAHRANMDYLTQIPQNIPRFISESVDAYKERAACVTSVLDEILRHQTAPPQMFPS